MTDTVDTLREHAPPPPNNGRGGFLNFWSSIPGILTAVAAVITAVTGFYLVNAGGGSPAKISDTSGTTAQAASTSGASTPAVPTVVVVDLAALGGTQVTEAADRDQALMDAIDGCEAGYQESCVILFEELVNGCEAGVGVECDALFLLSDSGSALEEYGATCGYRFPDDYYANDCERWI